jgi:hypothetical protein
VRFNIRKPNFNAVTGRVAAAKGLQRQLLSLFD